MIAFRQPIAVLTAFPVMVALGLTSLAEPSPVDTIPVSDDYVLRSWDTDDGLPSNFVRGIAQTPDGYLWVASWKGLARFDGVAFTPFLKEATPGLESDRVRAVYVARSGDLWVGLEFGGVARMRGNQFETIAPIPPSNSPAAWISSFAEDAGGGIWFGYASIGKAVRWQDGKLSEFTTNEGLAGIETFVHADAGGRIWFATKQACGIFDGTRFQPIDPEGGERVVLAPASDGGMWAARAHRLLHYRADGSRDVVADISRLCDPSEVTVLHEDRAGNVWIGTRTEGLFRFRQGNFVQVPTSHPDVECIFEGRENNLWVGTRGGGLDRLRPRAFFLHQKKDGLHNDSVTSLCQDGEGKLWILGSDGTPVHALDSANQSFAIPPNWSSEIDGIIISMCSDPAGGVWMAGSRGLFRWRDGSFNLETFHESDIRLLVDKQGDLWAATTQGALVRHRAGTNTLMPIADGHVQALALGEDLAGRLWVGTKEGMVFQRQNEHFLPVPLPGANPGETIRFIEPDVNDTVWIGSLQGGLYRWRAGQIKRLPHEAGLPVDDLRSLAIEPDGDFWIGTDHGLFRAARNEIDTVMDGRQQLIRAQSYGRNEGLPSLEFEIGVRNTTTQTRDGHIWFATARGALEILPQRFQKTAPLLPVLIEEIRVDGTSMPIGGSEKLELPPKPGQVEIRYTLPQLSAPEQMRFRYRLIEPGNEKWVYAGNQRKVTFTHLPPGPYRFEVAAAVADGPWLPAMASLGFTVRAAWWEMAWFRLGAGLLGASALAWLVRFIVKRRMSVRIQQLTDKLATQQALEKAFEETQALKNQFRLAIDTIPGLVWISRPDGNVELLNQRWLEYAGLSLEDAIGMGWQKAVHPDDLAGLTDYWRLFFASGKPGEAEARLRRFDGAYRWFLFRAVPFHDSQGNIVKWYGTKTDIEDRKRAEDALRLSEACMARAQQLASVGSYSYKNKHKGGNWDICEYWSAELWRIADLDPSLGFPSTETIFSRIHPEDRQRMVEANEQVIKDGRALDIKYKYFRADGELRLLHTMATPIFENGAATRLVGATMDITEQEQMTLELRRREMFLTEAQKLSHTGSFGWKVSTDEHFWSDETFRIWEYDASTKITLRLVLDRIHPEDIPRAQQVITCAAENGQDFDLEYRLLMPGGSVKHIHVVAHAVGADLGNIEFIGAVMDITERKKAQEALNAAKARFEGILEIAEDAIISMDSDQRIILFNQGAEKVFGYAQSEIIGKPLDILLPQRFAHSHRGHIEGFAKSPDVSRKMGQRREVFGRRKDGSEFPAEASISKLTLGNELVFTVILRDITDLKRAEQALRKSEQQWKDVFENNPTIYFMLDAAGIIMSVNPFGAEQLGYTVNELIGSSIFKICHELDRVADQEKIAECLRQLGRAMDWEFRKIRKDGSVLWVRKTARAVMRDDQPIVLVACEDITERKRAEEALRRSETLLAEGERISHTGSWVYKPATDELTSSKERFRIFGLDPEKTPSSTQVFSERVHPDDKPRLRKILDSAIHEKRDFEFEYRVIIPDGVTKHVHTVAHAITNESGELVEFFGSTADITERKRAEEALVRSEAFLAEGQRISHTGSWSWKPATGEWTSSKERFRIFGLDPETTNPSFDVFWERVHPEDKPRFKRVFDAAVREKSDFKIGYRIVTPDWVIKHVHTVAHAITNASGELVELVGSTMDITERKRAEERAQSHNEAVRLALNSFVEELDLNQFLGQVITGLTKQFQATASELWLFEDSSSTAKLFMTCEQGKAVWTDEREPTGLPPRATHIARERPDIGRIPKIIELPAHESLLQPAHLEPLKHQGIKTLLLVPLVLGEQNLGFVELRFVVATRLTSDDVNLAQALVHHATLALQLSRLAHRTEQMAVTEERNRMAREIHDTLAQAFAGVVLHSEALGTALGVNKSRSEKALLNIQKLARSGLEEARRSVQALRPRALEGGTLSQALEQMAKRYSEEAKFACEFKQQGAALKLSAEIQNELFRIAQEAMTNVSKHAQAKSVWITLESKDNQAILTVRDDGIGFAAIDSPKPKGGYGLSTMRERAQRIGGQIEIISPTGGGAAIRVLVPLTEKEKPSNQTI